MLEGHRTAIDLIFSKRFSIASLVIRTTALNRVSLWSQQHVVAGVCIEACQCAASNLAGGFPTH